jgi:hypothetical protein
LQRKYNVVSLGNKASRRMNILDMPWEAT